MSERHRPHPTARRPTDRPDDHPTRRPSRRTARVGAIAVVAGLSVLAVGCSGTGGKGQLLVASDTSGQADQSTSVTTDIWAADPGDELTNANRVAQDVTAPIYINSLNEDGTIARDLLGTTWDGQGLLSYADAAGGSVAAVADPGSDVETIATSDSELQTNVLRRGVYVATGEQCVLATSAGDAKNAATVGTGLCQVSEDERWVVSWPAASKGGNLTIRDLRTGTVRTIDGTFTSAVALGHGATVLAIEATGDGARGVIISAEDGKVVDRTDTYTDMQAMPTEPGSTGFVVLAAAAETAGTVSATELLWIDTSGDVRTIDRGALMLPVRSDSTVTYVHFGDSAGSDSVREWDSADNERTVLLSGRVGAAAVGSDSLIATKDTDAGVELYRSNGLGELEHVTTIASDGTSSASSGGASSTVDKILTLGDTSLLQVTVGDQVSLARIDLSGDDSDVPAHDWANLLLEGVDTDGTALVTGHRTADATKETIGVVTPSSDAYVERTTAEFTGLNLIHEGVLYVTDQTSSGKLDVRSVRAQGNLDPTTLWADHQLAGATWPTDNGATTATLISRAAVLQQQQQQQSQAQSSGG